MNKQKSLLKVDGLKKYFPIVSGLFRSKVGDVKAVDDIDFEIAEGEVLGVVGESGSGKSTAGRAAIRLIEPTEGFIQFDGKDLRALSSAEMKNIRRDIQMVFQDPYASLNPRRTVGDSIGEGLIYHRLVKDQNEKNDAIVEVLDSVGMSPDVMNRYPHEFSGGQQQRICIGRAISMSPKLIICDEAVSALDISVQAQILNLFSDLRKKMNLSYLFISHDLSVVKHICDRVIVLYLGKIMEEASTETLFRNPKHPYTKALLSAIPKSHPNSDATRMMLTGEIPTAINPPSGCPFRTRCPYAKEACKKTPPKRESIDENGVKHTYHCIL
ncbi:MAG: oligopeptide/dipeptide ABC transporter ATP-binding protein [Chlamydiota bacterium]|nr:oligopeptide/dipeptide ABC transporter ATP-binding protein [Chlamydiota bacterium]